MDEEALGGALVEYEERAEHARAQLANDIGRLGDVWRQKTRSAASVTLLVAVGVAGLALCALGVHWLNRGSKWQPRRRRSSRWGDVARRAGIAVFSTVAERLVRYLSPLIVRRLSLLLESSEPWS